MSSSSSSSSVSISDSPSRIYRILVPLPSVDFDTTEVCVPVSLLLKQGHKVTFATPDGLIAKTDPLLLTGVLFGQLGASDEVISLYYSMISLQSFKNPIKYDDIISYDYDGLLLS